MPSAVADDATRRAFLDSAARVVESVWADTSRLFVLGGPIAYTAYLIHRNNTRT
jgi:hypothetical protein